MDACSQFLDLVSRQLKEFDGPYSVHSFQYDWKDPAHIYYESYISSRKNQLSFLSEKFIKSKSIMHRCIRTNTENETHVNPSKKQGLKNIFWISEISYQEYMQKMQRSKNNFLIRGIPLPFSEFDENSYKIYLQKCLEKEKHSKSIWSYKFQNGMWLVKRFKDSISRAIHCIKDLHNLLNEDIPYCGGHSFMRFQFNLGRLFGRRTWYKIIGLFCAFGLLLLIPKFYFSERLNQIIGIFLILFFYICYSLPIIKWEYRA